MLLCMDAATYKHDFNAGHFEKAETIDSTNISLDIRGCSRDDFGGQLKYSQW